MTYLHQRIISSHSDGAPAGRGEAEALCTTTTTTPITRGREQKRKIFSHCFERSGRTVPDITLLQLLGTAALILICAAGPV